MSAGGQGGNALSLDADWSLHPALKDSIAPLWQARQIAFVPFTGTDDMSRSHFETQDTIELGQPVQGSRQYGRPLLQVHRCRPRPSGYRSRPQSAEMRLTSACSGRSASRISSSCSATWAIMDYKDAASCKRPRT